MPWRRRKAARRTGNGAEVHANSPALGADRKVPVCRSKSSSFGTTIAGRLVATSAFKVGFGYRVVMPAATYFTWHGANLEGRGLAPTIEEPFSFESSVQGRDNQLERATQFLRVGERSAATGPSA